MIRLPPLRCTFATQISLKMSTLDILSSECYDSLQCRRNNKSCETSFRSISHRAQQTGGAIYGYVYNQPQHGTAVQTASAARRSQKVKPRPSSGILARSYAAKHGQRKPVKILDEEYVNSSSIYSQKSVACICKKCDRAFKDKTQNPAFSKKAGFSIHKSFTRVLLSLPYSAN